MKVMSCNLRYDNPSDGENSWRNRSHIMKKIWDENTPDVIGIQEGLPHQIEELKKEFNNTYEYIGEGRERDYQGEQVGIFFKSKKFNLLDFGHFWLSKTPNVPGSKDFNSNVPRMVSWLLLSNEKIRNSLLFLNTHLDNESKIAREWSIDIITEFLQNNYLDRDGVVITGDFNEKPNSRIINEFIQRNNLVNSLDRCVNGHKKTYHGFSGDGSITVDYIFCSQNLSINKCKIITDSVNGNFPSDHFPIYSILKI